MRPRELVHSGVSIKQIACFLEVGYCLNFVEAAFMLGLSQSSVTKHIQNLETALKVPLLERDRKHVELSREGEYFYRHLNKAMNIIMAATDAL